MKKFIVLSCILLLVGQARAQNCSQNLQDALRSYLNGQFGEVSTKLEGCIDQLSREEKSEALKLLTDTYLVLGETETADSYLQQLLTHNPDFKTRESDLVELRNLRDTYYLSPQYNIGMVAGLLRPDYLIVKHQSSASNTIEPNDYKENMGYFIGFVGDLHVKWNFYASLGILFEQRGFEQEEIILGIQRVSSKETEYLLNIPLTAKYVISRNRIRPYIMGGFSGHIMMYTKGDLSRFSIVPENPDVRIGVPYTDSNYNLTFLRRGLTFNWLIGVGVEKTINGGFIIELGMTYERGLNNLIEEENRFSDTNLTQNFAYVPDDIMVSAWMFSIGVKRSHVKPIKK